MFHVSRTVAHILTITIEEESLGVSDFNFFLPFWFLKRWRASHGRCLKLPVLLEIRSSEMDPMGTRRSLPIHPRSFIALYCLYNY